MTGLYPSAVALSCESESLLASASTAEFLARTHGIPYVVYRHECEHPASPDRFSTHRIDQAGPFVEFVRPVYHAFARVDR